EISLMGSGTKSDSCNDTVTERKRSECTMGMCPRNDTPTYPLRCGRLYRKEFGFMSTRQRSLSPVRWLLMLIACITLVSPARAQGSWPPTPASGDDPYGTGIFHSNGYTFHIL